jgi:hypothetical protein
MRGEGGRGGRGTMLRRWASWERKGNEWWGRKGLEVLMLGMSVGVLTRILMMVELVIFIVCCRWEGGRK